MSEPRRAMKLKAAATAYDVSVDTLRRAIRATTSVGPDGRPIFPPPLKAKQDGRGHIFLEVAELDRWFAAWPDA